MNLTEPDVIQRVLDDYHVKDSGYIAQIIHSALIKRRHAMLSEELDRRTWLGLA